MANSKITDLPEITSVESTDVLVIVDVSVDETKKIKVSELKSSLNLTKIDVGLSNVDNTSDADKPISNSTQAALGLKANEADLQSHVNDLANPHQVTKAQVGLDQVDNTSDADKPVSIATQTALDLKANSTALQNHIEDLTNPHQVTKSQIGLDQVDNTSDADKPISTATQSALNLKEDLSNKGAANGYTPLVDGLVPAMYLPGYVDDVIEVANYAALPILGELSKLYITLDTHKTYRWSGTTYVEVSPSDVNSVNGHTGIVVLTKSDIGLSNVNNTSDADKPVSTATLGALEAKANSNFDNLEGSGIGGYILPDNIVLNPAATVASLKTSDALSSESQGLQISSGSSPVISGEIRVESGDAISSGNSGDVIVKSGNTVDAESGDVRLETGIPANGASGRIYIETGSPISSGDSGSVNIRSGTLFAGISGDVNIESGGSTTGSSGKIDIKSGDGASNSGEIRLITGGSSNTSGRIDIYSGEAGGLSGPVYIATGNSTSSNSGEVLLETGNCVSIPDQDSGNIAFATGQATRNSGSIILNVGVSTGGNRGNVSIAADHLNMNSSLIKNVSDPVDLQDSATKNYVDDGLSTKYDSSNPAGYITLAEIPAAPVTSVNSQTGDVVLDKSSVGLSEVDNTSDADKPVSTATQTALNNIINEYYIPKQVVNPSRCVSGAFPKLSNGQTSGASGNLIAQQVILVPFFINSTVTINSWTVRAGSGGIATASPVEVGFYSHEDGLPTNLIHSASITIPVLAGSTTSEQPITPVTLNRGVYWAAILNTSGATISLTDSNYASGSSFDLLFAQLMGTSTNITSSVPRGFHTSVAAGVTQLPASLVSRLVDFQYALANQSNLRIRTAVPIFYFGYTL